MSEKYLKVQNLSVVETLYEFINNEAIPGTDIDKEKFWEGFSNALHELTPTNDNLLKFRQKLQAYLSWNKCFGPN